MLKSIAKERKRATSAFSGPQQRRRHGEGVAIPVGAPPLLVTAYS
jgi:hypothetical protein